MELQSRALVLQLCVAVRSGASRACHIGEPHVKTLRGSIPGPLVVEHDLDVQGTITGDTLVCSARRLYVRGAILGNLTLEPGASVVVYGTVSGRVRKNGGTLVITHPESGRERPSNAASSSTSKV